MRKDEFIDEPKQFNMIDNYIDFLKRIEELKLFMVEFNKESTIKPGVYFSGCIVNYEAH